MNLIIVSTIAVWFLVLVSTLNSVTQSQEIKLVRVESAPKGLSIEKSKEKKMKLNRFLLVLGLTAIGLTTASKKASALTWTIGTNSATNNFPNTYHGQSFTPNVLGSSGSGTPGATAYLQSFIFGSNSSGKLYIYSNQYSGTPSQLSSGSGLVGVSSTADSNGIYNFANGGLLLSSVFSQFYAYTDSRFISLEINPSAYSGGSAFSSTGGNFTNLSNADFNFSATFTDASTQAVPFEFSPTEGMALGLPLFMGLRILKKRRALKNSSREVHDLTSAR